VIIEEHYKEKIIDDLVTIEKKELRNKEKDSKKKK
jgi:hypothetical protein